MAKVSKTNLLIVAAIVVAVLLVFWAGWWLIFKYNAYMPDKSAVEKNTRQLMDSIGLKGKEVYSSFSDAGCESNSIGLSTSQTAHSKRTSTSSLAINYWQTSRMQIHKSSQRAETELSRHKMKTT